MKKQNFPFFDWPSGEWVAFNTNVPFGLYCYRYVQYKDLVELSQRDVTVDTNTDQQDIPFFRDTSLNSARPLGAIALAMHIVAFEDYLRQQISWLMKNEQLMSAYPKANSLIPPGKFGDYFKPSELNKLNSDFQDAFGFNLIKNECITKIHDLFNVRNIIFHFGGIINDEKRKKFQFYGIESYRKTIDPSYTGVTELSKFIFDQASHVDTQLRTNIFRTIRDTSSSDWKTNPSEFMKELILNFNYFGYIPTLKSGMVAGALTKEQTKELEAEMLHKCLADIEGF